MEEEEWSKLKGTLVEVAGRARKVNKSREL